MTDPIVFYDGHCGLCHRAVRFLLTIDRQGVLRFAPLAGVTANTRTLPACDSLMVVTTDGRTLVKSAAIRHALELIGCGWRMPATVIGWIPTAWADGIYDLIARQRRGWFAMPQDSCPRVSPALRGRFLP